MSAESRVHFFEGQFLRAQDLVDEQGYHLAARRRHNVANHGWGIESGLELAQDQGSLLVHPGVAIDGYGRELLLDARRPLDALQFDALEADSLDVWLFYDRRPGAAAPSGYGACGGGGGDTFYRWIEAPRVEMSRRVGAELDPRRPPRVAGDALRAPLQTPPPDDPLAVWPVYLGTILRDRTKPAAEQFTIDAARRPYVGITAETIDHPARAARLELGARSTVSSSRAVGSNTVTFSPANDRRFAVFVPEDVMQPPAVEGGEVLPRLELSKDGELRVRGGAAVEGDVRLSGGALVFAAGQTVDDRCDPEPPAMYRVRDEGQGDRLRVDLGSANLGARAFVIGFSTPDGKFEACLEVEVAGDGTGAASARVTVFGDLVVQGTIQGEVPDVVLSEDARRAIEASFMSGVAAANA